MKHKQEDYDYEALYDLAYPYPTFVQWQKFTLVLAPAWSESKLESDWSSLFVEAFMITKTGLEKFK